MKILIVADEPVKKMWDYYEDGMFNEYDLILSCGDLPPQYLSFLTTMAGKDVIYVHGNHDDCYVETPPEGCICADDKIINYKGLRILGLGGSQRYKIGKFMYTEKEMRKRVKRLKFQLWRNKGFDILLTHAPILNFNDGEDFPHRGYGIFGELLKDFRPLYMIHGHMHKSYGRGYVKESRYEDTLVINGCGSYVLEIPDELIKERRRSSH